MTTAKMYINNSSIDSPLGTSGVNWVEWASTVDKIVLSKGSDIVIDGAATPSATDFIQAGILLTPGISQVVPKYFLKDDSAGIIRDIFLAGNQNKQYVFAVDFDGATATEPVLEIWDDANYNTINNTILGAGTASNSWFRGVATNTGVPGVNWTGTILAGSGTNRYLNLNDGNGPLLVPTTLYFNLKVIVPASATTALNTNFKFAIKYASA